MLKRLILLFILIAPFANAYMLTVDGNFTVGNTVKIYISDEKGSALKDVNIFIEVSGEKYIFNTSDLGYIYFTVSKPFIHKIHAYKDGNLLIATEIEAMPFSAPSKNIDETALLFFTLFVILAYSLVFAYSFFLIAFAYSRMKKFSIFLSLPVAIFFGVLSYRFLYPLPFYERFLLFTSLALLSSASVFVSKNKSKALLLKEQPALIKKFNRIHLLLKLEYLKLEEALIFAFLRIFRASDVTLLKHKYKSTKKKLDVALHAGKMSLSSSELQKTLEKIHNEIVEINKALHSAVSMKKDIEKKKTKSLEELKTKRELEIMIEDLCKQIALQLGVPELPEFVEELPEERSFIEKIFRFFRKKKLEKTNVKIILEDEFGRPLSAKKAEFYLGRNPVKPIDTYKNEAYFYFDKTFVELYIRYLGFIDYKLAIPVSETMQVSRVNMQYDFVVTVTDTTGKELEGAFVRLSDENDQKISDIFGSEVWKTPWPKGASAGKAYIALDPTKITSNEVRIKVIKAGYAERVVTVKASSISTASRVTKNIAIEEIAPLPSSA